MLWFGSVSTFVIEVDEFEYDLEFTRIDIFGGAP